MRRSPNAPDVQWSIRISTSDRAAFHSLLPIHGSGSWFIETALRAFVEGCEPNDALQDILHRRIQTYLNSGESLGELERMAIAIPTDLYTRFNNLFPEKGAASWFVRQIVATIVPELQAIALEERVETAVRSLLGGLS